MKCILWDLMVTCTLFLFVLYLVFCCLFLIYNLAFLEKGKNWFVMSLTEEMFTTGDVHTHTHFSPPSQVL